MADLLVRNSDGALAGPKPHRHSAARSKNLPLFANPETEMILLGEHANWHSRRANTHIT
jgi:hypothetical protein